MNEQQLANIFSEHLDQVLRGEPVDDLAVTELQEPLAFSQRLNQISFRPSTPALTAFDSQLATWFGTGGATAGLSITWLFSAIIGLIVVGALGGTLFAGLGATPDEPTPPTDAGPPATVQLPASQQVPDPETAIDDEEINEAPVDSPSVGPAATPTVEATLPRAASVGDSLAPRNSLGDTLPTLTPIPETASPTTTATPAATSPDDDPGQTGTDNIDAEEDHNRGHGNDPDGVDEDNPGHNNTDEARAGDDDRGHGNDLDGFDEDNPGNSTGVAGGKGLNPSDFSQGSGSSGGQSGGGGKGTGQENNTGGGKDNNKDKGKGNGKDK